MESLGATLKQAREGRKLSLSQVAEATRISYRHLQNIEEGRYGDLPGGMYNRAFLRAYSEFLGLDPQPLVSRYDSETAPVVDKKVPKHRVTVPQHSSDRRIHPLSAWIVMLAASTAGVFFSRHWIAEVFSPYFSRPPAAAVNSHPPAAPSQPPGTAPGSRMPQAPAPAPPQQPASPVEISSPSLGPAQQAAAAAPGTETPAPVPSPGRPAQTATPPEPAGQPGAKAGATDAPAAAPAGATLRVRLSASQRCWASVTADNRKVLSRQLEPGDEKDVVALESVIIVLGNAGGVHVTINGRPAKPFGRPGEVVKVVLTERNLADFLQPSPTNP